MALTPQQQQILEEARERAAKLVEELEAKAAELEKNPPKIDPKKLQEGQAAMRNAVAAVKKALENIEKAAEIADRR
jgi:hypothetical protein